MPRAMLNSITLAESDHTEVDGARVEDAAWYYPEPLDAAENIRDHVAFYGNKVDVAGQARYLL